MARFTLTVELTEDQLPSVKRHATDVRALAK